MLRITLTFTPVIIFLTAGSPASAQIRYPESFVHLLETTRMEFYEPTESSYKTYRLAENPYLNCPLAIRSKKEKLEIRYAIEPFQPDDPVSALPHVRCIRLLGHLASNDEDYIMTGLDLDEQERIEEFNADWAKVFFFTPKADFSSKSYGKMLALFKENQGMAFVFFLFDDENNDALDRRFYALRFQ